MSNGQTVASVRLHGATDGGFLLFWWRLRLSVPAHAPVMGKPRHAPPSALIRRQEVLLNLAHSIAWEPVYGNERAGHFKASQLLAAAAR
jgi:hypothetical protein